MKRLLPFLIALLAITLAVPFSDGKTQTPAKPYVVEYYYKIKWGYAAEWLDLYKRNHYPLLVKEQELGRIVSMSAATPVYHAGEANRWDSGPLQARGTTTL